MLPILLVVLSLINALVSAQLSGRVGPVTSASVKLARKQCNITSYGAKQGRSGDIGPAINAAFSACKNGGTIVVPSGDWGLRTWVNLSGGKGFALELDGTIHRSGEAGGNMIMVQRSDDVEIYSRNGQGAIQGNGYQYHARGDRQGPRILRFVRVTNFSVHDIKLVDAPAFHFSMDTCRNGEVYNMIIRGAYMGGIDGIDVWSDNVWIHDVMVTNKDECVDIKNPAHNILVENIYCNWSGGSAFGSLGTNVSISKVHYRNIYTVQSNQMLMIKSNGGSGTVEDILLENFIGHSNAYSLNIDSKWGPMKVNSGPGITLRNITFKNWKGTCSNGAQRGPIKIVCPDQVPCKGIHVQDFAMWTDTGNQVQQTCQNAYGSGACLKSGSGGAYPPVKRTVSSPPSAYKAPRLEWDLKQSPGTTNPIRIPDWPRSFFPGTRPIKPLAATSSAGRRIDLFDYRARNDTLRYS